MGFFSNLFKKKNVDLAKEDLASAAHRLFLNLEKINNDFCLGLSTNDIKAAVESNDALSFIASKVSHNTPTIAEYCLSMEATLNRLMDEMHLSEADKDAIYAAFLADVPFVTNELIGKIAAAFSRNTPPHLYFLRNKINYELASLGLIMQQGIESERSDICKKVTDLRRKRGYI